MIKDIEEKSKTKFSIEVEFSFSFKASHKATFCDLLFSVKSISIKTLYISGFILIIKMQYRKPIRKRFLKTNNIDEPR